ncbi:hypothetical protein [uncultured Photobacterium sp.]|uniref:hypothetical protein n=1 Tax=uncultured Photobacterium sp. TaxID=173973 RepID=UPI0026256C85|nr:hypothetical protein [uncultured Photobacterium sp.]
MKKFTMIAFALALAGCSSTPVEQHYARQQAQQEAKEERVDSVIDSTPEWYVTVPQPTDNGFYAAGTSTSSTLKFAVAKAKMDAEFALAKQYQQLISGNERSFSRESGTGDNQRLQTEAEQTIDKLVKQADLSGYEVVDSKLLKEGATYRSYVLVFMPYDTNNQVKQARDNSTRIAAQQAYDNLEQRVDAGN